MKQPFETEFVFTVYPHAFTRVCRLFLSPNSYRVTTLFIEKYFGFHRSEYDWIPLSMSIIKEDTTIKKNDTVISSLRESQTVGLLDIRSGYDSRSESYYRLNINNLRVINQIIVDNKFDYLLSAIKYLDFLFEKQYGKPLYDYMESTSNKNAIEIASPKNGLALSPKNGLVGGCLLVQKMDSLKEKYFKRNSKRKQKEERFNKNLSNDLEKILNEVDYVHSNEE